jgi:dTDP-4-dehydrorhamnose reductase
MLGRELSRVFDPEQVVALAGRGELDITDAKAVSSAVGRLRPQIVINAAAWTDVDGAEAEPAEADRVNRAGPAHLADACRDIGALLVHYSTDYVFDGRARVPYRVDDAPNPINVYGRTKLAGEREVMANGCRCLLIRTSWLFAAQGHNFVRTILDLARRRSTLEVVDDQSGRPTYAPDLARMTRALLLRRAVGTWHATNDGTATWYELARAIVDAAGLDCEILPCSTESSPRPARRPAFSVLDLSATAALMGRPRHWKEAVTACVRQLVNPPVVQVS